MSAGFVDAIILGALQGATEFLPVSSSGHLRLMEHFLGLSMAGQSRVFLEIALHLATLLAVAVYFRRETLDLLRGLLALPGRLVGRDAVDAVQGGRIRWASCVVVSFIPTASIGFLLDRAGVANLGVLPVALLLLVTGVINFAVGRAGHADDAEGRDPWSGEAHDPGVDLTMKVALCVGIAQGLAVLPGISRSGATIACALALGSTRFDAARFSFVASMPAIAGAAVLTIVRNPLLVGFSLGPLAVGCVIAFAVGLLAVHLTLGALRRGRWRIFAYYCWAVGVVALYRVALH